MACLCGVVKTTLYFAFIENIHHKLDARRELCRRNYDLKAMPSLFRSALWHFLESIGVVEEQEHFTPEQKDEVTPTPMKKAKKRRKSE